MSSIRDAITPHHDARDIAGRLGVVRVFDLRAFGAGGGVRVVVTQHPENRAGESWAADKSSYRYADFTREQAKALMLALAEVIREGDE